MKLINHLLLAVLALTTLKSISQTIQAPNFGWPVNTNTNSYHRGTLIGSPGEYRPPYIGETDDRFHLGVDLAGDATDIYSIEVGSYPISLAGSGSNRRMEINGSLYWHIIEHHFAANGATIVKYNDLIGDYLQNSGHLHYQKTGTNPLYGSLYSFEDNTVADFTAWSFRKEGHNFQSSTPAFSDITLNGSNYPLLYDKIDIVVQPTDYRVNPNGNGNVPNVAPNRFSYEILDNHNTSLSGFITNIDFTNLPTNFNAVVTTFGYGTALGNPSIFKYIVTNSLNPPYNRYWNSLLKTNTIETWPGNNSLNARIIDEARYKDGINKVSLTMSDIDYYDYPNNSNNITLEVIIDNFLPYIKKVEVFSGSKKTYSSHWEWNSALAQLDFFPDILNLTVSDDQNAIIHISTSEPMKSLNVMIPTLITTSQNCTVLPGTNDQEWELIIPASNIAGRAGTYNLSINGYDLASNPVWGFSSQTAISSATIPVRQYDGSWIPAAPSGVQPDTRHIFQIAPSAKVDFFGSPASGNSPLQVSFTNQSTISCSNWRWSFPGGTPSSSSLQNPVVTYSNSGSFNSAYNVNLEALDPSGNPIKSELKQNYITIFGGGNNLSANFAADKTTIQAGEGINFSDLSSGDPEDWEWDFGDGNKSKLQNPPHSYSNNGKYTVKLKISGNTRSENEIEKTNYITVSSGMLNANFNSNVTTISVGNVVNFSDASTGNPEEWEWYFDGGQPSYFKGENPPPVLYNSKGMFNVRLVVKRSGVTDAELKSFYIIVSTGGIDFSWDKVCYPDQTTITFHDVTKGYYSAYNTEWTFTDPSGMTQNSNLMTPTFPLTGPGIYNMRMDLFDLSNNPLGSDIENFEIFNTDASHCGNHIQDFDEEGIDCGGCSCGPCGNNDHCKNFIQDEDETGVDCGGSCGPCVSACMGSFKIWQNTNSLPALSQYQDFIVAKDNTIVSSGKKISFTAGNEVSLETDFAAEAGSDFTADLAYCECKPLNYYNLEIAENPPFYFHWAISPNDDGVNDNFILLANWATSYEFEVFERYVPLIPFKPVEWNSIHQQSGSIYSYPLILWNGRDGIIHKMNWDTKTFKYSLKVYSCNGDQRTQEWYIDLFGDNINPEEIYPHALDIQIYPNPTTNKITIYSKATDPQKISVEVTDESGKVYFSLPSMQAEKQEIDFSTFPKGVFMVKCINGKYSYIKKIINL